jgi:hypothetical protein
MPWAPAVEEGGKEGGREEGGRKEALLNTF